MVNDEGRQNLSGDDATDKCGGAQFLGEKNRKKNVNRAQNAAAPHPERRVEIGHRQTHHRADDGEKNGADQKRQKRGANRRADHAAQRIVDADLNGQQRAAQKREQKGNHKLEFVLVFKHFQHKIKTKAPKSAGIVRPTKAQTLVQNATIGARLATKSAGISSRRALKTRKIHAPMAPDKIQPQKFENGTS